MNRKPLFAGIGSKGRPCYVFSDDHRAVLCRTRVSWVVKLQDCWLTDLSCTVASSRVVYAYSRDGALPGSRWLKKVNRVTQTPVNAVWFVLALGGLLGLLMFASPAAIGAVFSIGAIAQYVAFIFPVALKLFVVGDKFRPGKVTGNDR